MPKLEDLVRLRFKLEKLIRHTRIATLQPSQPPMTGRVTRDLLTVKQPCPSSMQQPTE